MPLNCAIITDSESKGDEIRNLVQSPRIRIVGDSYKFGDDFSNYFPLDVVIVSIAEACAVTSVIETISRIMPTAKIICIFTSSFSTSWLFYNTIRQMVYRSIPESEISSIPEHLEEIYSEIYREVRRIISKGSFNEVELAVLKLLQQDLQAEEIANNLNLSIRSIRRLMSECAVKLSCSTKGLGVFSIRALGDLTDLY